MKDATKRDLDRLLYLAEHGSHYTRALVLVFFMTTYFEKGFAPKDNNDRRDFD
ncbi:hypothetical protein FRUB_00319 [Fimbriiglobus ruber]|uniref:Uncharacterized protein n=1 Tax=Fimbriiglobus ruber TaxID=1908690 RepID=A0A225DYK5_9BACT|nr:hypothetical protein FRUB_00319 [Fimbriiglobus ruber]